MLKKCLPMQRMAAKLGLGGASLSAAPTAVPGAAAADLGAWDALEAPLSQPELHAAQATAVTLLYGRDFARQPPVPPPDTALEAARAGDAESDAEGAMATAERTLIAPYGNGSGTDVDLRSLDFDRVVSKVLVDPGVQRAVFRALREDFWRAAQRRAAEGCEDSLLPVFEDLERPLRDQSALRRTVERLLSVLGDAVDGVCRALGAAPSRLAWVARDARERAASALHPDPTTGPGGADAVVSAAVSCAALAFTVVFARRALALLRRGFPGALHPPGPSGAH